MKRFHVHVRVEDLPASIRFYSTLFAAPPAVVEDDYAKWMLDEPRINFAISDRGRAAGVDHLGFQVDSDAELDALEGRLRAADANLVEQTDTTCCYARSDKYWVTDPSGIAWETFHTMGTARTYGEDLEPRPGAACCDGDAVEAVESSPSKSAAGGCCG